MAKKVFRYLIKVLPVLVALWVCGSSHFRSVRSRRPCSWTPARPSPAAAWSPSTPAHQPAWRPARTPHWRKIDVAFGQYHLRPTIFKRKNIKMYILVNTMDVFTNICPLPGNCITDPLLYFFSLVFNGRTLRIKNMMNFLNLLFKIATGFLLECSLTESLIFGNVERLTRLCTENCKRIPFYARQ